MGISHKLIYLLITIVLFCGLTSCTKQDVEDPLYKGFVFVDKVDGGYILGYKLQSNQQCKSVSITNFNDLENNVEKSFSLLDRQLENKPEECDAALYKWDLIESTDKDCHGMATIICMSLATDEDISNQLCSVIDEFKAEIVIITNSENQFKYNSDIARKY